MKQSLIIICVGIMVTEVSMRQARKNDNGNNNGDMMGDFGPGRKPQFSMGVQGDDGRYQGDFDGFQSGGYGGFDQIGSLFGGFGQGGSSGQGGFGQGGFGQGGFGQGGKQGKNQLAQTMQDGFSAIGDYVQGRPSSVFQQIGLSAQGKPSGGFGSRRKQQGGGFQQGGGLQQGGSFQSDVGFKPDGGFQPDSGFQQSGGFPQDNIQQSGGGGHGKSSGGRRHK